MEIDGIPRHKQENPYKYTEVQLAKRKGDIRAMIKDYPTVPPMWVEWIYDVITNKPQEEVEKIMNEGLWANPGKFAKAPGGLLHTVELLNEDLTPILSENKIIN